MYFECVSLSWSSRWLSDRPQLPSLHEIPSTSRPEYSAPPRFISGQTPTQISVPAASFAPCSRSVTLLKVGQVAGSSQQLAGAWPRRDGIARIDLISFHLLTNYVLLFNAYSFSWMRRIWTFTNKYLRSHVCLFVWDCKIILQNFLHCPEEEQVRKFANCRGKLLYSAQRPCLLQSINSISSLLDLCTYVYN